MSYTSFRKTIWDFYKKHGRHELPWRKTINPYRILVSEVMLQQTQVDRVVPFYQAFIRQFPTVQKLAAAPLADVLRAWQGLGYNRRAKMLHGAAKAIVQQGMPKTTEGLETLPGVGPYTARAVAAFAWNEPGIVIETNIRTLIIHHFFPKHEKVGDDEIATVLAKALPQHRAREWYWALMDYGAYLKRSGVSHNARAKVYTKQSRFSGSAREARGALLRELAKGSAGERRLTGLLGDDRRGQLAAQLEKLDAEGLVQKKGSRFSLPR